MGPKPKKRGGKKEVVKKAAERFEIRDTDEAGKGIFAKKDIDEGTRIFIEQPILLVDGRGNDPQVEPQIMPLFEKMSVSNQEKMLDLSAIEDSSTQHFRVELAHRYRRVKEAREALKAHAAFYGGEAAIAGSAEDPHLKEIKQQFNQQARKARIITTFRTNAVALDQPQTPMSLKPQQGIFPVTARLNHSCVPNVLITYNYKLDPPLLTWHTLRKIKKDEQLTRTYLPEKETFQVPSSLRQVQLSRWGFRCSCEACDGPKANTHDQARKQLGVSSAKYAEMTSLLTKRPRERLEKGNIIDTYLKHVKAHTAVYKVEAGLDLTYMSVLFDAARQAHDFSREEEAYLYAQKLVKAAAMMLGTDTEFYELFAVLLKDIEEKKKEKHKGAVHGLFPFPKKADSVKSG